MVGVVCFIIAMVFLMVGLPVYAEVSPVAGGICLGGSLTFFVPAVIRLVQHVANVRKRRQREHAETEPEEEQPTCTLEIIKGQAPHMKGRYIEMPVAIRSLTGQGNSISGFALDCEPKRTARWRPGEGHGDRFEDLGGLCTGDIVPGDRPLVGTVFFELDEEWFDTATLALDPQYGPRVQTEPFDRSLVVIESP